MSGSVGTLVGRNVWFDGSTAVGVGDGQCDGSRWSGAATARAAYQSPAWRVWVAYTTLHSAATDTVVRVTGLSAGVQRRLGAAMVAMSIGPRRDRASRERVVEPRMKLVPEVIWSPNGDPVQQETTYVADTVTRIGTLHVPDLGVSLAFSHRAFSVDAAAHVALAGTTQRADPLAQVQLAYDLAPRVSAVVGLLSRTPVASLDIPAGFSATLGFRIRGARVLPNGRRNVAASEFRLTADSSGHAVVRVRAVGAQRVEIAGDFTHWDAVSLQRENGEWWRATIATSRGPHQVSIRVNGGPWAAPPGLPPVRDEFGGTVGLLLVP